jgi:hypothetical protein
MSQTSPKKRRVNFEVLQFSSLLADSITSWEEMEKAFLNEYYPASVFLRKRVNLWEMPTEDSKGS